MFADNWCIKSNERVYGPYSTGQLRKFAHEGRFAETTLIAPAGSREWREARQETTFAAFFGVAANSDEKKTFGRHVESTPSAAKQPTEETDAVGGPRRAKPLGHPVRKAPVAETTGSANFVLIFEVVSAAATRVEAAVMSLGSAFRLA